MRAADNPFRTDRVLEVRYRFLDGGDMETLLERLEALNFRAAIVGPEGSGKTTLQEDMADQLQVGRGRTLRWLRLNRENRRSAPQLIDRLFSQASVNDLLFVDGAEQIGPLRWRLFKRRAERYAGMVINTHAAGRLPTLWECQTTPDLLRTLIDEILSSKLVITGRRGLSTVRSARWESQDVLARVV